ncbi:MAG: hypothetical protein NW241_23480 [Bacteroidia bacterium]|nr:hypothetical protein [Bacteroidia bacterium]
MSSIVVECKADETMVRALLGQPRRAIIHQPNKGEVGNFLRKRQGLIAIVDEDPGSGQPAWLKPILESEHLHGIRSSPTVSGHHLVIVICPRLEEWVLSQAAACRLDPKLYGLPTDARSLHKEVTRRLDAWSSMLSELAVLRPSGVSRLQNLIPRET